MDETEDLIITISDVFKKLNDSCEYFYSDMLKLFPNMETIDKTHAKVVSLIAINYAFLDGLRRYKVPDEKVKKIIDIICYMLNHIEPRLVEMINECEKYVFNLKEILRNKKGPQCTPLFLRVFPYGCWIFEKLYTRPPAKESQDEMKQALAFGEFIVIRAILFVSDKKKSL